MAAVTFYCVHGVALNCSILEVRRQRQIHVHVLTGVNVLQCFDAVGWAAGRASEL